VTELDRPLLVYDGDCSFCRAWIARWRHATGDRLDYAPYQEIAARFPNVPLEDFRASVHLFETSGRRSSGAEAVYRSLSYARDGGTGLWFYEHVPGFAAASEAFYRLVAAHRDAFDRITRWLWGRHLVPRGHARTNALFLRLIGLVYFVAFTSLWPQVIGLAGQRGILSIAQYLSYLRPVTGPIRYWFLPTLCWLNASDAMLIGLCAVGTALSALLVLGLAPLLCLIGAWVCYLSLATACQSFLWYQWDSLLIEAGFLAIFLAPWRWRLRGNDEPPRLAWWLVRWLLFRLLLASAAVKLTSGDLTWRHLTALDYHFWSQPLPAWTSWYADHVPRWLHRFSTITMFVCEGLAPFLLFTPRRLRFAGALANVALQCLIALTGNYGFFNLLTIVLCITWLDDGVWPWRGRREPETTAERAPQRRGWPRWILAPVAIGLFAISLLPLLGSFQRRTQWLGPLELAYRVVAPFRIVNGYGLFAMMTTERLEIVIEGSADGEHWLPYEFRYKPGDVARRPDLITPYMPRLDWQMWFAALGNFRSEPSYLPFCARLLEGSPSVVGLLATNPFPRTPPRFLRAIAYDYRFTDPHTRKQTGAWWRRTRRGAYMPVLQLRDGNLIAVTDAEPRFGQSGEGELGSHVSEPDSARAR
jgi:predicted DCC family thiol-disulfide oxidoreductase YuxK